jgi:hypothetical protein
MSCKSGIVAESIEEGKEGRKGRKGGREGRKEGKEGRKEGKKVQPTLTTPTFNNTHTF